MISLYRMTGISLANKPTGNSETKGGQLSLPSFSFSDLLSFDMRFAISTARPQTFRLQTFVIAASTLSAVNGTLNKRAPVASKIALPTAAPTAMMAGSPPPCGA